MIFFRLASICPAAISSPRPRWVVRILNMRNRDFLCSQKEPERLQASDFERGSFFPLSLDWFPPAECFPFPRLYIGARKAEIPHSFRADFRTENMRKLSLANIEFIGFAAVNRFAFLGFFHQVISLCVSASGFFSHCLHKCGFAYAINPGLSCFLHNLGKACG